MTAAEAMAILRKSSLASGNDEPTPYSISCAAANIAGYKKRIVPTVPVDKCTARIEAMVGNAQVIAYLIEDYPANPGTMRVFSVGYIQAGLMPTHADIADISMRLKQRFGPPDVVVEDSMYWGFYANMAPMNEVAKNYEDFLTVNPDGTISSVISNYDAPSISEHTNGDLDVIFVKNSVHMFLYDYPYADVRSAAIHAAYEAVTPPPLKMSF